MNPAGISLVTPYELLSLIEYGISERVHTETLTAQPACFIW